jgi:tetratricopeptide (TPR) repeat protein
MFDTGYATANDLKNFAGRTESRGLLPGIVRRLLVGTPGVELVSMAAGEGIWRPDPDGYVECSQGNAFVPNGRSVWEVSNRSRPRGKAEGDYVNRSDNPGSVDPSQATFVFVTMRHFKHKVEWRDQRRADGIWKDVRVYDSEDLCTWLETNRDVYAWASRKLGLQPICATTPAQLPADVNCFVGRSSELEQLGACASDSDGAVLVISGQPGVGKTALATRFAHANTSNFPDGQVYIELRGTSRDSLTPEEALGRALQSLEHESSVSCGSAEELAATYRSVMSRRRAIVVLDDVASEQQVRQLIPGKSQSLVIITSRSPLSGLDNDLAIHLDELSMEQAVAFLRKKIGRENTQADEPAIRHIANACGGLPIALNIAAHAAHRSPKWSLEYLASRLSDERHRLDGLAAGDLAVRASFQLSYDLLSEQQQALFRQIAVVPGPTFDARLAAAAAGAENSRKVESTIDQLVDRGLVELASTEGHYRLHDLLRIFGKEKAETDGAADEGDAALKRVVSYVYRNLIAAGRALSPGSDTTAIDAATDVAQINNKGTQALAWFDHYLENAVAVVRLAIDNNQYNAAIEGILWITSYLELRGLLPLMERITLLGLEVVGMVQEKGSLSPEFGPQVEAILLSKLAVCAQYGRRYDEALALCEAAQQKSDDAETIASIRNTRGNILLEQHQHKRALDEYKSAAEHYRQHGDARMQRMIEHNIGATLMRMGNAKGALPYLRNELEGCRADHDELGEAHALNTLGLALLDMDDIDSAREVLSDAIAGYQRLGDAVHASHATNDLGLALTAAGEHEAACECHLSDYAICTEIGDMHGAGRALIRVADNLIKMGTQHVSDALKAATLAAQLIDERDLVVLAEMAVVDGEIAYAQGRLDDGRAAVDSAVDLYCGMELREEALIVQIRHAHCLLRNQLNGRALVLIESVLDEVLVDDRARPLEVNVRALLTEALARAGRSQEAQAQARLIEQLKKSETGEEQWGCPDTAAS